MFLASTIYWYQTQMPSPQPDIKAAKIRAPDLLGFRNIAFMQGRHMRGHWGTGLLALKIRSIVSL